MITENTNSRAPEGLLQGARARPESGGLAVLLPSLSSATFPSLFPYPPLDPIFSVLPSPTSPQSLYPTLLPFLLFNGENVSNLTMHKGNY
jgi:hypothetical protein